MKKFSKKLIYYHLVRDFFVAILIGFVVFSNFLDEEEEVISEEIFKYAFIVAIGVGVAYYIINAIYQVFFYKTSGYEVNDSGIVCNRGVLFRKKSILDYNKMHTVNKKQGLIQKIFGIAYLMIDSGSTNTAYNAEIWIVEDVNIIDRLIEKINLRQKGIIDEPDVISESVDEENVSKVSEKTNLYEYTTLRKVLYSLISSIFVIIMLIGAVLLFMILMLLLMGVVKHAAESIFWGFIAVGSITLLAIIGIPILTFIGSLINSLIAFYDFKVYRLDDAVEISYGLFVRNDNVFKLKKIRAVKIKQNFIQKLFKVVSMDIEVIGYGEINSSENDKVSNVFIPLCKKEEANDYINKILPQYLPVEKEYHSPKFFPHISWVTLILSIVFGLAEILMAGILVSLDLYTAFLVVTVIIALGFAVVLSIIYINQGLKVKNEGLGVDQEKVTIYQGGLNKTITTILKKDLIGIDDVTTPLRAKKGIYSFVIHFRSNMTTNTVKVSCIEENAKEELMNLIKF